MTAAIQRETAATVTSHSRCVRLYVFLPLLDVDDALPPPPLFDRFGFLPRTIFGLLRIEPLRLREVCNRGNVTTVYTSRAYTSVDNVLRQTSTCLVGIR